MPRAERKRSSKNPPPKGSTSVHQCHNEIYGLMEEKIIPGVNCFPYSCQGSHEMLPCSHRSVSLSPKVRHENSRGSSPLPANKRHGSAEDLFCEHDAYILRKGDNSTDPYILCKEDDSDSFWDLDIADDVTRQYRNYKKMSRRSGPRRHTVGGDNLLDDQQSTCSEDGTRKREAFLDMLARRYPQYADRISASGVASEDGFPVRVRVKVEKAAEELPELPCLPDNMTHDQNPAVKCETVDDDEPPKKREKNPMDDLFGDVFITSVEKPLSVHDRIQSEISSYKTEAPIPLHSDPLEWWKAHHSSFPILSRMAKYYLGIPATSVPSERVFSAAGEIVCAQRASLSGDNVDMLIFLKSNLRVPSDLC